MAREQNAVIRQKRKKQVKVRPYYYDYNLLAAVILLICFGLVMLYSASYYEAIQKIKGDDMFYFRKQALISLASVAAAVIISKMNYRIFSKLAGFVYISAFVLMGMVRFSPLGYGANGSKRWLNLKVIQFQPSEVAKIAVILFLPVVIIKMGKQVKSLKAVCILLIVGGVQALGAKVFTDNLSTALIILGIACVLIYLAHPKTMPFVIAMAAAGILIAVGLTFIAANIDATSGFRIRRVLTWLNPEGNLEDGGFQVIQGLYAIGSGGFFGKGLGNSEQKLSTIPEAQNDMIFSIICEELGVFGAVLVLLMFGYLLYRLFFIAQNAPDLYGSLIVSGIFAHISLQVILNICVVLNLIPTTGITLPFISYGGTSVLFLMIEIGIALSVSRQIKFTSES
ncbi:FtsW/RodA/SpoVE family cell cycle protein [Novisyntrophococcus fermenticellae]|uniref:FtsW/RodA/SpoVE family cell cycle protein n=1 Tax=Novisyntrophococcus fermenticellae TaxID=2068655 RepID=UPI001E641EDD|nr:putative peptidoglycan glycosyltransferase FtsW [Novisyntrophococcus fermenticellae]